MSLFCPLASTASRSSRKRNHLSASSGTLPHLGLLQTTVGIQVSQTHPPQSDLQASAQAGICVHHPLPGVIKLSQGPPTTASPSWSLGPGQRAHEQAPCTQGLVSGGVNAVRAHRASVTWRWVPQRVTAIRLWPERQGDAGRDFPLPGLAQGTPVAVAEPESTMWRRDSACSRAF